MKGGYIEDLRCLAYSCSSTIATTWVESKQSSAVRLNLQLSIFPLYISVLTTKLIGHTFALISPTECISHFLVVSYGVKYRASSMKVKGLAKTHFALNGGLSKRMLVYKGMGSLRF